MSHHFEAVYVERLAKYLHNGGVTAPPHPWRDTSPADQEYMRTVARRILYGCGEETCNCGHTESEHGSGGRCCVVGCPEHTCDRMGKGEPGA